MASIAQVASVHFTNDFGVMFVSSTRLTALPHLIYQRFIAPQSQQGTATI